MFLNVLGSSILAGVATLAGTGLILYKYKWARHNSIHLMSFAAGVMLSLAFLHLIPEAIHIACEEVEHIEETEQAGKIHENEAEHDSKVVLIIVLLGFAAFHALESIVLVHPRHDVEIEAPHKHGSLSILAITGLTAHSIIDGVIIAVGFKASSQIGIMTTMAVVLHEAPEGMVTTSILLHDTMERAKIFWFSLLVAAVTPAGAVVSYFALSEASENVLWILLAFAAGSFIYIAAADLIPETHREEKRLNTVVLIASMAVLYIMGLLLGHGH